MEKIINPKKIVSEQEVFRINLHGEVIQKAGFLEVDQQVVQIGQDNKFLASNITIKPGINSISIHSISSAGRDKNYTIDYKYDPSAFLTRSYDSMGYVIFQSTQGRNTLYKYNDEGLVEEVSFGLGTSIKKYKYYYYANNNLCFKEIENTSNSDSKEKYHYLFDENQNIFGEFVFKGTGYKSLYMYTPHGKLLYRIDRGHKKYFYHLDIDGSVIGISDNTGKIVCAYSYDFFGNIAYKKQDIYNPFLYLGHFYDKETGFYFHKGFSGFPEDHAIRFNKKIRKDYLQGPNKVFKDLFKFYYELYPKKHTPKSLLPESINFYSPEKLIEPISLINPDVWLTKNKQKNIN